MVGRHFVHMAIADKTFPIIMQNVRYFLSRVYKALKLWRIVYIEFQPYVSARKRDQFHPNILPSNSVQSI